MNQNVGTILPGVRFSCTMSRSGGTVTASVNGSCPITFNDSTGYALPQGNKLIFCIDDLAVPGENSSGKLHRIELRSGGVPVHVYELNGTLSDSLGGPSLVSNGGSITGSGYIFGPNQGLDLTIPSGINWNDYSLTVDVTFDDLSNRSWQKIVDFKNRSSDAGLYVYRAKSTC